MNVITTAITSALISSIVGVAVASVVSRIRTNAQENSDTQHAMHDGMRCIMRKEIMDIHKQSTERGYITRTEHEHVSQVYDVYHALGGNGTATKLIHDMNELPAK